MHCMIAASREMSDEPYFLHTLDSFITYYKYLCFFYAAKLERVFNPCK